jgi:hypothetical protein
MARRFRLALLCAAALAAVALAGCGNKEETVRFAETEGIYVTVDDLKYQIQISRLLTPSAPDDAAFLNGVSETDRELAADEVWYGIFMRVENDGDEPAQAAEDFVIKDTQGAEYRPVEQDPTLTPFVYQAGEIGPGGLIPFTDTPPSENSIRGNLILFKVKADSLYNRPLVLEIESPSGGENAEIDIDV